MFGIGFFEILVVGIGIIIFVRPKDLPQFIYKIGKIYKELRLAYQAVINEFNNLADQGRDFVEKTNKELNNTFSESTIAQSDQRESKTKKTMLAKVLKDVDKDKVSFRKTSQKKNNFKKKTKKQKEV